MMTVEFASDCVRYCCLSVSSWALRAHPRGPILFAAGCAGAALVFESAGTTPRARALPDNPKDAYSCPTIDTKSAKKSLSEGRHALVHHAAPTKSSNVFQRKTTSSAI